MARGGVYRCAMPAHARKVAHLSQRVQVEDADMAALPGSRHVQVAAVGIGSHVVESAVASDELDLLHLVGAVGLCVGQPGKREQNSESYDSKRLERHTCASIDRIAALAGALPAGRGSDYWFFRISRVHGADAYRWQGAKRGEVSEKLTCRVLDEVGEARTAANCQAFSQQIRGSCSTSVLFGCATSIWSDTTAQRRCRKREFRSIIFFGYRI